MIKPQSQFPLLERYKSVFKDGIKETTIFAYDGDIYCDYDLPNHLIVHETTHHRQQDKMGLDAWVDEYLTSPAFRLEQELEAYRNQLASISDRNTRAKLRLIVARDLSSDLYGNIININEAVRLLNDRK